MQVTIDHKRVGEFAVGLRRAETRVPSTVGRTLLNFAKNIVMEMRSIIDTESVYSNSGWLSRSITIRKLPKGYNIYSMNPYATYVDEGTRPHFIPFGLGMIEGVDHPGARAMRFSDRAVDRTINDYFERIGIDIENELRRSLK